MTRHIVRTEKATGARSFVARTATYDETIKAIAADQAKHPPRDWRWTCSEGAEPTVFDAPAAKGGAS